jgi:hypothetical protein
MRAQKYKHRLRQYFPCNDWVKFVPAYAMKILYGGGIAPLIRTGALDWVSGELHVVCLHPRKESQITIE